MDLYNLTMSHGSVLGEVKKIIIIKKNTFMVQQTKVIQVIQSQKQNKSGI
jgi:hypothetical protein